VSAYDFPRSVRLLTAADYAGVFRHSKRYSGRYVTILAHSTGKPARLGLAIAKKKAKRASDRNRLKRLTRESFRHRRFQLHGFEMVVMNRENADKAASHLIRKELDRLLRQIAPDSVSG